jgi:hypothetical protein
MSFRKCGACVALATALFVHQPAASAGQNVAAVGEPQVPEKEGKALRAFRLDGNTPRIDGRLDDEAWTLAEIRDDFVQNEPDNMEAPTETTSMQAAYDDKYLYIAVRCRVHDVNDITTGLGRRDNEPPSDLLRLSIDPRHDHLTAYVFEVNPSGVMHDYTFYDDTRSNNDYDAVWEVRTSIAAGEWIAEYRIPFSQMRFSMPPGEQVVWGLNLRRDIYRRGEYDRWVATPRGVNGFVSRFGHLVFESRPAPPRRVEFLPFVLGRQENPISGAADRAGSAGFDMRVGLGPATSVIATVNPDFAQVEQDPAVLNLSIFETFFPEKRPFFLEDSLSFLGPFNQMLLFHSRRIGQKPGRYSLPSTEQELDRPDNTTILGALKVTGKTTKWTYGAISALTSAEYATVNATSTDADGQTAIVRTRRLIEPQTSYSVARVQRNLFKGTSTVGALATSVLRQNDANAYTGGIDYNIRWSRNRYQWTGQWAETHAPFSDGPRDDYGGLTSLNYSGKYLGVYTTYDHFGRNFKNTDIGFFSGRVNKDELTATINVNQPDPWKGFRSIYSYFGRGGQWNGDGLVFDNWINGGVNLTFRNFWYLYAGVFHAYDRLDDLDTRGGPPIFKPSYDSWNLGVNTDSRNTWQIYVNVSGMKDSKGGWNASTGPGFRIQPSPRLQANVSTSYTSAVDIAQWIKNTDVNGDGVTDNVYGRLRRNVLSVTARATFAFTRDLTLDAFLQPFVAVGDYSNIRRLARPRSFDFEPATLSSDPDFNTKSLRGNIVLRWEYVRGSTLYLVWNLSKSDASRPGVFSPFTDLRGTFSAPGTNIFMVKMNYWLGL